jgi:hypothetical protein
MRQNQVDCLLIFAFDEPLQKLRIYTTELKTCEGKFQFGSDFYQLNAVIAVIAKDRELSMRWPDGSISPLIPISADHFVDRAYWEEVKIERDASGKPSALTYDRFSGTAAKAE